ncbi:exopolysaccharide biosynthesis protein [Pseudonocardia hispaniensis]|uniref:Exopolysaccharide biosynthesis protein n=1 Tax=Pseudonocardia hispaniensis TaxID=904933 RepID=A0ABW1J8G6_9PSEU
MEDVVRLSVVGQLVRRRWRLLAALAGLGALVGLGLSLLFSPGYEAASRVLLQGSRDKQQVLSEAQVAMSLVVLDRTAAGLGWGDSAADLQRSVSAAVVDGNVIEISGTARNADRAQQLVGRVTQEYVTFSTQISDNAAAAAAATLLQRRVAAQRKVDETTARINELQGSPALGAASAEGATARAELDRLRTTLAEAAADLDEIKKGGQQSGTARSGPSGITVIGPAVVRGAASPTMPQFMLGGALVFGLVGLLGLLVAVRTDRRLRDEEAIATALGAPVLTTVDIAVPPGDRAQDRPDDGRRLSWNRLRDLLRDEVAWTGAPGDGAGTDARLRRLLARLRGSADAAAALLVLVPDDDPAAQHAARRLVAVADGTPVRVERVLDIAGQPTLADCAPADAVVVLASGTRTAWELVALAGACLDLGCPLVGAIVVRPCPAESDEREPPTRSGTSTMAGSA